MRVSVWGSSWYVEPTWTKRGSWQRKRAVWTPSTGAGRTPMTGEYGGERPLITTTKHNLHETEFSTRLKWISFVMGWRVNWFISDSDVCLQHFSSVYLCLCSYNGSLDVMLEVISQKPERYRIIVASHNEESVRRAAERLDHVKWKSHGTWCHLHQNISERVHTAPSN